MKVGLYYLELVFLRISNSMVRVGVWVLGNLPFQTL